MIRSIKREGTGKILNCLVKKVEILGKFFENFRIFFFFENLSKIYKFMPETL